MRYKFVIIFLMVSAFIALPFACAAGKSPASPSTNQPGIPSEYIPPKEDIAQVDEAIDESSFEVKQYHIPMILNDSVENHLEYFKTRGRDVFQRWLDRSARYIPLMKEIFKEKNLPEDPGYVALIESGFNP